MQISAYFCHRQHNCVHIIMCSPPFLVQSQQVTNTCKYKNKDVKPFTDFHVDFLERFLIAVGWSQLPARHPHSCSFNSPHHNRIGEKTGRTGLRRIMVWNKDIEITHKKLPNFQKYLAFKISYFILRVVDCPASKKLCHLFWKGEVLVHRNR